MGEAAAHETHPGAALTADIRKGKRTMFFKGVDFWPHNTTYPIMSFRRYCIGISWVLALLSAVLLFSKGLNFGVDFKGGSLFEVQSTSGPINIADLRSRLSGLGIGDVQIQSVSVPTDALIRVEKRPDDKAQQEAVTKIEAALKPNIQIRRTEVVGGAVSDELKQAGILAVVSAIIGILLYIWFRFEWQFGVAAILALLHDTLIVLGAFSLLNLEFGLSEVAAVLTLAGYSINDTVVVFDRIRENLRKYKRMDLEKLMDQSINETLSRTVLTATTTFIAVLSLYVFGTEVIRGFSFAMLFGIVIGTWSSIFVASPFLLWVGVNRDWSGASSGSSKVEAKTP
ncbi:MAG: protein translocase subunit SecF [Hyphomicrobiaceae bacterium]